MAMFLLLLLHCSINLLISTHSSAESIESRKVRITPLKNSSVSAFFVFGDSTVDPGNNNYFKTAFKSNFPPYGRDFPGHVPTGRFTNGRLASDFVAWYMGIKDEIPAYLDPYLSLDQLMTGVSFASAGSGIDPLTAQLASVIGLEEQLVNFKEYIKRVESSIGKERTKNLIANAVFLTSSGTNDFIVNYYISSSRRLTYTVFEYNKLLLQLMQQFIQSLTELGARKIAVVGLPPMGCLPAVMTINPHNAFEGRGCIEHLCTVARDYNRLLQNTLASMHAHSTKLAYIDIYTSLDDIIRTPRRFGFDVVDSGCCGSGVLEVAFLCNPHTFVCIDDSKYVFWDSIHPTEAAYFHIFESARPVIDQFILHP